MNVPYIDLTIPIEDGIPSYPGEPAGYFLPFSRLDTGGFVSHQLLLYSHLGTHVDAPAHFLEGGGGVETISLERLIGPAVVVDATLPEGARELRPSDIRAPRPICEGDRVVLRTGWDKYWGAPQYFTGFPQIGETLARYFVERHICLLGMDTPTPHATKGQEVHETLLKGDVIILEGLANLTAVEKPEGSLVCLPLPLVGVDGSPARVVWQNV
jgi:arylformamidase